MRIVLQRVYEEKREKGYRVLVDRLWPRGVGKQAAALDEWCKELAPSPKLRAWFGHEPARWDEFYRRYTDELGREEEAARSLLRRAGKRTLVLLYGAKDSEHTHALVLRDFLLGVART